METIDLTNLLKKYIDHVYYCEGTNFIDQGQGVFTKEEIELLNKLSNG